LRLPVNNKKQHQTLDHAMSKLPGRQFWRSLGSVGFTLIGALLFTTLVLLSTPVSPLEAYEVMVLGAYRNPRSVADVVMGAAPLVLCSAGLLLTFAVGLYNLGIEGQITMGAVFAMVPLRLLAETATPPPLVWLLAFGAGMVGGALWALVVALLKIYASVNEIFAGLGLNFIARGVALYFVFGPWKRPGIASMSGTEPLPNALWLPRLELEGAGVLRLAPIAPLLALIALALVWAALARTRWGLALRATGENAAAAERLGVPTTRRLVEALAGCGALAGIAGALQVMAVFHTLRPDISSGIGFLALLVVLLVRSNPAWVLPVAVAFASFIIGSIRLSLIDLDSEGAAGINSSISGVLQGALVLFALVASGLQQAQDRRKS
jgi:simple sugar transport system permease protein